MRPPPEPAAKSCDDPDEAPATLIIGLHGVSSLDPLVSGLFLDESLDEDAFSLIVKRTVAYGLGAFAREAPPSAQWVHSDAGGDWIQDGAVRQLAWLQGALARPGRQRIPIQAAARVLEDVLNRVGRFKLTGLHAVVPLAAATEAREALAYAAGWFAVADPATSRQFTVALKAEPDIRLAETSADLLAAVREAAHGVLSIEANGAVPQPPAGVREPVAGELQTTGMVEVAAYRCTAREWSLDAATWATELFIEALRTMGAEGPWLITVSAT